MTLPQRLFSLLLASLATLPVLAQDTGPQPAQGLSADPPKVDFGVAFEGETLTQDVVITNQGSEDWPVARIQTSCGCTVAKLFGPGDVELSTRPKGSDPIVVLAPGESVKTVVEFKTAGKHGKVSQEMTLHSTDTANTPFKVPVSLTVNRALQVTPRWVNLGSIAKSDTVEQTVVVEALEIGEWAIEGFSSQVEGQPLPDYISFEVLDEKGPSRRVKMTISGDLPVGSLAPRVRIDIDHERVSFVDFTVTGIVRPNVTFDAGQETFQENINFGQFGPDETVTKTLKITNTEPDVPYTLETVDLLTQHKDFFTTEVRTIEEGVQYEVDVTVSGEIEAPFFRGSLVLRAKHPDIPNRMIPFHGWVTQGG